MSREIKFRVWDKEEKRFVEFYNPDPMICCADGQVYCYEKPDNELTNERWVNNRLILQQYTGLKDCNNKEIYEGDIVKLPSFMITGLERLLMGDVLWEIIFENCGFYRKLSDTKRALIENDTDCFTDFKKIEIVGNIYETPELLKILEK